VRQKLNTLHEKGINKKALDQDTAFADELEKLSSMYHELEELCVETTPFRFKPQPSSSRTRRSSRTISWWSRSTPSLSWTEGIPGLTRATSFDCVATGDSTGSGDE
jgi:hypothetical protein